MRTVIAGKVIDPPEDNSTLMFIIDDLPTARQLIDYTDINMKDSTFHFVIERYLPQDIMIRYGQLFSVFVHPGDSLFVYIDGNKLDNRIDQYKSLKFSGEPAEFNRLWSIYKEYYSKNKPACSVISYNYLSKLIDFPYMHAFKNHINIDSVVPLSYYDTLKMQVTKESLENTSTSTYINHYFSHITIPYVWKKLSDKRLVKDTIINNKPRKIPIIEIDSAVVNYIVEATEDSLTMQLSLCEIAGQKPEGMDYGFIQDNWDIFDRFITEPYLRGPLFAYYNEVKYKCKKPEIATQAIFNDLKNTVAEKIYNRILKENKGKVIYLDCWETGCSPCRAEMPYSKKLMAKFDTTRVAFVYICFNSRKDAWKGLLSEWQLGGQHYFANRRQSKYLSKALSINGYPHYMLIDKNGNVVETGSRPSNDETYSKRMGLVAKD